MKINVEQFRAQLDKMRAARAAWFAMDLEDESLSRDELLAQTVECERLGEVYKAEALMLACYVDAAVRMVEEQHDQG